MEYEKVKEEYEQKIRSVKEQIDRFIESAVNYDELIEDHGDKHSIEWDDLVWNDGKDKRYFDNLQCTLWLYESTLGVIEDYINAAGDKKETHRAKKQIETFITEFRRERKECNALIEREQHVLDAIAASGDLLDEFRNQEKM